jgi:hypothetical protein
MSMKAMLLAAATAVTLLVPAAAMAQDWGQQRAYEARDDRRMEFQRWPGENGRGSPAYGYGAGFDRYEAYPAYRHDEARREWERRARWEHWRRWHRDHDRDYGRDYGHTYRPY